MKKILLLIIILLFITGCTTTDNNTNPDTPEQLDIIVPEGTITFNCKKVTQDDDNVKKTVIDTSHFDKKKQLINRKIKTIEEYKNKEEFKKAISIYSQVEHEDTNKIKYKYKIYEEEMIFAWVRAEIGNINNNKGKIINQDARTYLLDVEGKGYDCDITGTTKKELGLVKEK